MDTFIYDVNGVLHTKLFSKPSDTHAYLPPSSCHPYHVCKNNPSQIARRVRKISSEEEEYEASKQKFSSHLNNRGYSEDIVQEAFLSFEQTDRESLFSDGPNGLKLNLQPDTSL